MTEPRRKRGNKLTLRQLKWLREYEKLSGFEATIQRGELEDGKMSFADFAYANTEWLRQWAQDTTNILDRRIPR